MGTPPKYRSKVLYGFLLFFLNILLATFLFSKSSLKSNDLKLFQAIGLPFGWPSPEQLHIPDSKNRAILYIQSFLHVFLFQAFGRSVLGHDMFNQVIRLSKNSPETCKISANSCFLGPLGGRHSKPLGGRHSKFRKCRA